MTTTNLLSHVLAPEDIQVGDYLAILRVTSEYVVPPWQRTDCNPELTPVMRFAHYPANTGRPLKVLEICLPFVLVEKPNGKHTSLDVRRMQLARISAAYGERVFALKRAEREQAAADQASAPAPDNGKKNRKG